MKMLYFSQCYAAPGFGGKILHEGEVVRWIGQHLTLLPVLR